MRHPRRRAVRAALLAALLAFALPAGGCAEPTDPRPVISAPAPIFTDALTVTVAAAAPDVELRCTLDGSEPGPDSPLCTGPLQLSETTTIRARSFRGGVPVGSAVGARFERVTPGRAIQQDLPTLPGLMWHRYRGDWESLPDFTSLPPAESGIVQSLAWPDGASDAAPLSGAGAAEAAAAGSAGGARFEGLLRVPATGVLLFALRAESGARLFIDGRLVAWNGAARPAEHLASGEPVAPGAADAPAAPGPDGRGAVALERGPHSLRIDWFQRGGAAELVLEWAVPGEPLRPLPPHALQHIALSDAPPPPPRTPR